MTKKIAWKDMEQYLIAPTRLQDFLLVGISSKKSGLYYGPILSHVLQVFRAAEKFLKVKNVWYKSSPPWNNNQLPTGGKPFVNKEWQSKGIKVLQDISGVNNILDFQEIIARYGISKTSLFFYFRIRSACKAYRVPWGTELKDHPILEWIQNAPRCTVSYIYDKLNSQKYMATGGIKVWERDLSDSGQNLNLKTIWKKDKKSESSIYTPEVLSQSISNT